MFIIQIAIGVWLGGVALVVSYVVFDAIAVKIKHNLERGRPWYRGMLWT